MNRSTLKRAAVTVGILALIAHGGFRADGRIGLLTTLGAAGVGWMLTLGWTEGREADAYRRGYERRAVDDANARTEWARRVREHREARGAAS